MKYSELVQFQPIESVVQLRHADAEEHARTLVDTYVVSSRMAEQLRDLVFPQLQFEAPADNKGILIVGNYGTGKSHLMAVISAIAEHEPLAARLASGQLSAYAVPVAGRFRVVRAEIGHTAMSLRDIVCAVLEEGLSSMGVSYQFPAVSERHESKRAFQEMMAAFQAKHPDQGLLLVLDELLDYLGSRKDQALSLDLSFLREVGEICKGTRFRFIAGVQESLFDNPRFQFVADTLRRVKDRFEQVRIVREDVAYVVAERLLRKDARQQALVREHLTRFAPLFGSMNERMDEFVRLFPVHPAYIETFERVSVAEKREILRTLSAAIQGLVDKDVPADDPGLIAYDSYWRTLKDNASFRSIPDIREVIARSEVLESRVQHAFTRPQYRPQAVRLIHALSVHRLTTGDIYAPLGATAEEMRDDLCLLLAVPERDAEFLKTAIEAVLHEIVRTVSGQFLSFNKDNGQYHLDLKKDVDFDSLIEKKAEYLGDDQLDRYYFDALRRVVLEEPDGPPYVTGYRIWEYEAEWRERKAFRSGYLFFGAPNERSTAQPPRDFYLYFLQPFDPPVFADERKPDEVFFRLRGRDDTFTRTLRLYAGAREQALSASGSNKRVYEDKAAEHLKALTTWFAQHMAAAFEVGHEGRTKTLIEAVQGKMPGGYAQATLRDYVQTAASVSLAAHFQDKSPEFPTFAVAIPRADRGRAAQDALRWIAGAQKTKTGGAVLDALELLDGDRLEPKRSRYAKQVLQLLAGKGQGQVVNRSELLQDEASVPYWNPFRLEPEFLAVVLAALVHSGDIVLSLVGRKIDASAIEQFGRLSAEDAVAFKHIERPRDLPLGTLTELFDALDVQKGLIVNPASRDEGVVQLQRRIAELASNLAAAQSGVGELVLWGRPILSDQEQADWRQRLGSLKGFLESLQAFNTAAKLKNFSLEPKEIASQKQGLALIRETAELIALVQQLAPVCAYLGTAEAILGTSHPWVEQARTCRGDLLANVASPTHRLDPSFQRSLSQALGELKAKYQEAYLAAHQAARLGVNDDKKKATLSKDVRLGRLQKLAQVDMMPTQQLRAVEAQLFGLKTCFTLTRQGLDADPVCPECHFRPMEEPPRSVTASACLATQDDQLDVLEAEWTRTLLANLEDPTVQAAIDLLDAKGRRAVKELLQGRELPQTISPTLLKALQDVLSGLAKVVVVPEAVRAALTAGGMPCTLADLRGRFDRYLSEISKGKDPAKVRIVVE